MRKEKKTELQSLLNSEQLSFANKYNINLDDIPSAWEALSILLMTKGTNGNDVNEMGLMCESILDIIGDYDQ